MNLLGIIRVFARIRPMLSFEEDKGCVPIITTQQYDKFDLLIVNDIEKGREKYFGLIEYITSSASQSEVYEGAEPLLQSALDGLNVCIFAYGHTGSGKTYTMNGPINSKNMNEKVLMPRAFDLIFEKINKQKLMEVEVRMFILELYVDKLIDLFDASRGENGERIVIWKNKVGTVMPTGVNIRVAKTAQDLYDFI
jgi:kinesin family member C2/C3